jgi:hypothetical protein
MELLICATLSFAELRPWLLCDEFIGRWTDEAAYGLSPSLFGRMRAIAEVVDSAFEELDQRQAVKVQDRRLQPYLRSQLFIALVAELEDFLGSLLRLLIQRYPKKIGERPIKIERLVALGFSEALKEEIERVVYDVFYDKPQGYKRAVLKYISAEPPLVEDF